MFVLFCSTYVIVICSMWKSTFCDSSTYQISIKNDIWLGSLWICPTLWINKMFHIFLHIGDISKSRWVLWVSRSYDSCSIRRWYQWHQWLNSMNRLCQVCCTDTSGSGSESELNFNLPNPGTHLCNLHFQSSHVMENLIQVWSGIELGQHSIFKLNFQWLGDSSSSPSESWATLLVPGPAGLTFITCLVASDFLSHNPMFGLSFKLASWKLHLKPLQG